MTKPDSKLAALIAQWRARADLENAAVERQRPYGSELYYSNGQAWATRRCADELDKLIQEAPGETKEAETRQALRNLVNKLDMIATDPQFQSMAVMNYIRGITYTGPNWADELKAAKAVLVAEASACPAPQPQRCACGDALTQCPDCIIADYQAQHTECRTCCPSDEERLAPVDSSTACPAPPFRITKNEEEEVLSRTGELAEGPAPQHASTNEKD